MRVRGHWVRATAVVAAVVAVAAGCGSGSQMAGMPPTQWLPDSWIPGHVTSAYADLLYPTSPGHEATRARIHEQGRMTEITLESRAVEYSLAGPGYTRCARVVLPPLPAHTVRQLVDPTGSGPSVLQGIVLLHGHRLPPNSDLGLRCPQVLVVSQ